MLTESEKKELNYYKLSADLKLKIDTAFESPDLIIAIAYSKQIQALTSEMINKPFTIRGEDDIEVSADGVKEALKEAITSRQNTETALKVLDSLLELAENLKKIQARLSPEQQDLSKKEVITHTDVKKVAFGK